MYALVSVNVHAGTAHFAVLTDDPWAARKAAHESCWPSVSPDSIGMNTAFIEFIADPGDLEIIKL